MTKSIIALGIVGLTTLISCSPVKKALVNNIEQPVYEIAVRQVKDGKKTDFDAARTAFIEKLVVQNGVSNDREFSSFYSLPTPDKLETFIGMTQYQSFKTPKNCLLYTSDAADERSSVDLGGRRIKKKKKSAQRRDS